MAPEDQFRVLVRTERLADAFSGIPNTDIVQVNLLPDAGLLEQFRFLHTQVPKLAAEWCADLYISVGEYSPLSAPPIANILTKSARVAATSARRLPALEAQ
jgi:hypothetical protein